MEKSAFLGARAVADNGMILLKQRNDGALRVVRESLVLDDGVLDELFSLSDEMKSWEHKRYERLNEELRQVLADRGVDVDDAKDLFEFYKGKVWDVLGRIPHDGTAFPFIPSSRHRQWQTCTLRIDLLPEYGCYIRDFDVSCAAVESCREAMDANQFKELVDDYALAVEMQQVLIKALDEYEKAFSSYLEQIEKVVPGISNWKNYCRDFSKAFGGSELDYVMTPGNQCVVECVDEYYLASVLEERYQSYGQMTNVVAYSHRRSGFNNGAIALDSECDVKLIEGTNFGYGQSSYFNSTLSYRGVNAVNASFLMYFAYAEMAAFSQYTYNYEVDEDGFLSLYEDASRLSLEYRKLGEAAFVNKYFRDSLSEIADLLYAVANTDTFLEFTTLDAFSSLTESGRIELFSEDGLRKDPKVDRLQLSDAEKGLADEIVALLVTCDGHDSDGEVDRLADKLRRSANVNSYLQRAIVRELARNRIRRKLAAAPGDTSGAKKAVDSLFPPMAGLSVSELSGFELVRMRTKRALAVINPIDRLRKIAELTEYDGAIESIVSSCFDIANQAKAYISHEIEPELNRLINERDKLKAQLDELESRASGQRVRNEWLEDNKRKTKSEWRRCVADIGKLTEQKRVLRNYVMRAGSLRDDSNAAK